MPERIGLAIRYEDDGIGVPQEKKGSIFEMSAGHYGPRMAREVLGISGISIRETGAEGRGAYFKMMVPRGHYPSSNGAA